MSEPPKGFVPIARDDALYVRGIRGTRFVFDGWRAEGYGTESRQWYAEQWVVDLFKLRESTGVGSSPILDQGKLHDVIERAVADPEFLAVLRACDRLGALAEVIEDA